MNYFKFSSMIGSLDRTVHKTQSLAQSWIDGKLKSRTRPDIFQNLGPNRTWSEENSKISDQTGINKI